MKRAAETQIKLLGRTYMIVEDLKRESDDYGAVQFRKRELHIHKNLVGIQRSRTILHEAIHAGLGDLGLTHWAEENFVGPMEYIFAHLAKDNPWLVKELMSWREE